MEADEKICPRCAELVKSGAQVCKHCGHDFVAASGTAARSPLTPPTKKTSPVLLGCLGIVAFIVFISIIGSMTGNDKAPAGTAGAGTSTDAGIAKPPIVVTASALAAAYDANEAAAQQKYGAGPLEVTGVLESVDLGIGDEPSLILRGNEMFTRPHMDLTEASQAKASSLSKGQKVTAICASVSEIIGTPMLKDCELK